MFFFNKGIKINGSDLWLDSTRRREMCVVSHGHLDHARKHQITYASEATVKILKKRVGGPAFRSLSYRKSYHVSGCEVTLFPAGHILGSAQILVETYGRRLLYSGDFNTETSATAAPIEIPEADILIMEGTFGRPKYRFPAREVVHQQLRDFVEKAIEDKCVPIVCGYVLGKAQEAMKILGDAGFALSVHGSVAALAKVYEEFGITFGRWRKYKRDEIDGKVLIIPRNAIQSRMVKRIERKRIVFLSGWAMHSNLKYKMGVDSVLPLSDHADFEGLISYARKVNPGKIYTTHCFKDFPNYLRKLGFDAQPLNKTDQLSLF